jgi:hypothetical protein
VSTGLETYTIDEFIVQKLSGDGALTALLSQGAQSIHSELVPDSATMPAVVFWPLVPGTDVSVVGGIRIGTWAQMIVTGIADVETYAGALHDINARIDALLHNPPPTTQTDGSVFASVRITPWRRTEVVAGVQRRQLGGVYKILSQT